MASKKVQTSMMAGDLEPEIVRSQYSWDFLGVVAWKKYNDACVDLFESPRPIPFKLLTAYKALDQIEVNAWQDIQTSRDEEKESYFKKRVSWQDICRIALKGSPKDLLEGSAMLNDWAKELTKYYMKMAADKPVTEQIGVGLLEE